RGQPCRRRRPPHRQARSSPARPPSTEWLPLDAVLVDLHDAKGAQAAMLAFVDANVKAHLAVIVTHENRPADSGLEEAEVVVLRRDQKLRTRAPTVTLRALRRDLPDEVRELGL